MIITKIIFLHSATEVVHCKQTKNKNKQTNKQKTHTNKKQKRNKQKTDRLLAIKTPLLNRNVKTRSIVDN